MEFSAAQMLDMIKNKDNIPKVLIVWGTESYYKDLLIEAVLATSFTGKTAQEREVITFDKDLPLRELENSINTYPFFSSYNLIVIKDPKLLKNDKQQESTNRKEQLGQLTDILLNVPDFTRIICSTIALDKRSKFYKSMLSEAAVVESKSIKSYNLRSWLVEQAELYGAEWSYDGLERVTEYMSYTDDVPLALLAKEIEKLDTYVGTRKQWTGQDVETIFSALPEVSAFALNNAIAEHKVAEMLELLALEEKKGTNLLKVSGIISSQLRRMLAIKELMSEGADKGMIASTLKIHPFVVQKTMLQCKAFSTISLEEALINLAQLNIELRRGGRKFEQLEESLLILLQSTFK